MHIQLNLVLTLAFQFVCGTYFKRQGWYDCRMRAPRHF